MAKIAVGFGILLIIIGIAGFIGTGSTHYTALIPTALGVLILIAGILAVNENRRKHAMHAAAGFALLGFLGTLRGLLKLPTLLSGGAVERPAAVVEQAVTAIACIIFIALCIRSFISARRSAT